MIRALTSSVIPKTRPKHSGSSAQPSLWSVEPSAGEPTSAVSPARAVVTTLGGALLEFVSVARRAVVKLSAGAPTEVVSSVRVVVTTADELFDVVSPACVVILVGKLSDVMSLARTMVPAGELSDVVSPERPVIPAGELVNVISPSRVVIPVGNAILFTGVTPSVLMTASK